MCTVSGFKILKAGKIKIHQVSQDTESPKKTQISWSPQTQTNLDNNKSEYGMSSARYEDDYSECKVWSTGERNAAKGTFSLADSETERRWTEERTEKGKMEECSKQKATKNQEKKMAGRMELERKLERAQM